MLSSRRTTIAIPCLLALAIAAVACGSSDSISLGEPSLAENGSGGVYLALGDSIAAGGGASDAATTSYVALVAEALRARFGEGLTLRSLAVGSHTSQELIDEQLPQALEQVAQGDVRLVTLTIGGNDLGQYAASAACLPDPSDPACPLEDGLLEVEERLGLILQELREAGPDTAIVIMAYPNLFSSTGSEFDRPAEIAFDLLDGVITSVARRHDVLVADPRRDFVGNGHLLSHLRDPTPDAHPNDAGYRVIAQAFLEVLGLED